MNSSKKIVISASRRTDIPAFYMDDYPKIRKRLKSFPGFSFVDPPLVRKIRILLKMERTLLLKGISLKTCCEKKLLELLPAESSISQSSCIPNDLLAEIFGGQLSFKKDTGQRTKKGCGCMVSVCRYRIVPSASLLSQVSFLLRKSVCFGIRY